MSGRTRSWYLDTLTAALRDIRACFWPLAIFDLVFKLLAAAVISPVLGWLVRRLVSQGGHFTFANDQILAFLASPAGVLWVVLAGAVTAAVSNAEWAGMLLVVRAYWSGRRPSLRPVLLGVGRRAPRLFELATRKISAYVVVSVPFLVGLALVYRILLSKYEINYLVHETPPVWWWALAICAVLLVVASVLVLGLFLRWIFAVPILVFERVSAAEAMRRSRTLMRGRYRRVVLLTLIYVLGVALAAWLALWLVHLAARGLFAWLPASPKVTVPLIVVVVALDLVIAVAASFAVSTLIAAVSARVGREWGALPSVRELDAVDDRATGGEAQRAGRIVFAAVAVFLAVSAGLVASTLSRFEVEDRVEITAHRGASSSAPENTLAALRAAIEEGAHWAELDVRQTNDGQVVVVHDEDFMRFGGDRRKIWEMSFEEVREVDVGSWFDPAFAGERVPTLRQAIGVARGRIGLNIELKFGPAKSSLVERVVEIIREEEFAEHALITSLDINGLAIVREIDSSIRIGAIVYQTVGQLRRMDAEALSISTNLATSDAIVSGQRAGKEVHVWTVNDRRRMSHFINLGVDNILTDYPGELAALLAERAELSDGELLLLKLRSWLGL